MEKELFPMKRKERRKEDGAINAKNSNKNRRKSDKKKEDDLVSILRDSVYISNGIVFTNSFENISSNLQKQTYIDVDYMVCLGKEKNYVIQSGVFVIILDDLAYFENSINTNVKFDDIASSVDATQMKPLVYNGTWWVEEKNKLKDVRYKNIQEEKNFVEDLKEMT